jgi:5-methylcytosine-specific restriction endonuclease McrA
MPHPKDDPKSSEWRPYIFARDQWHCRICGDHFLYSEMVRKHIADEHDENMPPSMYEYSGAQFGSERKHVHRLCEQRRSL